MPMSYRAFHDLGRTIRDNYSQILVEPGVFTDVVDGVTIFARDRTRDGALDGVVVNDVRDPLNRLTYTANTGAFVATPSGPRIVLEHGTYQKTDPGSEDVSVLYFDRVVIGLAELADADPGAERDPREMSLPQLLIGPYPSDEDKLQRRAEGHQRIVIPIYAVTFTLLALASLLHGSVHRTGRTLRMAVAVLSVVSVQAAGFALQSLTARLPFLAPIMYLVPVGAGTIALVVLIRGFRRVRLGWRMVRLRPARAASLSPA
jgi:lipopolysaccharide export system permease protein